MIIFGRNLREPTVGGAPLRALRTQTSHGIYSGLGRHFALFRSRRSTVRIPAACRRLLAGNSFEPSPWECTELQMQISDSVCRCIPQGLSAFAFLFRSSRSTHNQDSRGLQVFGGVFIRAIRSSHLPAGLRADSMARSRSCLKSMIPVT